MGDRLAEIERRVDYDDITQTYFPGKDDWEWLIDEVKRLRTSSRDYLRSRQEFARENAQLRDRLHRCKEQLAAVPPDAAAPAKPQLTIEGTDV